MAWVNGNNKKTVWRKKVKIDFGKFLNLIEVIRDIIILKITEFFKKKDKKDKVKYKNNPEEGKK